MGGVLGEAAGRDVDDGALGDRRAGRAQARIRRRSGRRAAGQGTARPPARAGRPLGGGTSRARSYWGSQDRTVTGVSALPWRTYTVGPRGGRSPPSPWCRRSAAATGWRWTTPRTPSRRTACPLASRVCTKKTDGATCLTRAASVAGPAWSCCSAFSWLWMLALAAADGRGQVALGVGELLLVAGDQGVDPVVGLVELVLVVGEQHHPAEAGADRQGQDQAGDAEDAAREDSGAQPRRPTGLLGAGGVDVGAGPVPF